MRGQATPARFAPTETGAQIPRGESGLNRVVGVLDRWVTQIPANAATATAAQVKGSRFCEQGSFDCFGVMKALAKATHGAICPSASSDRLLAFIARHQIFCAELDALTAPALAKPLLRDMCAFCKHSDTFRWD